MLTETQLAFAFDPASVLQATAGLLLDLPDDDTRFGELNYLADFLEHHGDVDNEQKEILIRFSRYLHDVIVRCKVKEDDELWLDMGLLEARFPELHEYLEVRGKALMEDLVCCADPLELGIVGNPTEALRDALWKLANNPSYPKASTKHRLTTGELSLSRRLVQRISRLSSKVFLDASKQPNFDQIQVFNDLGYAVLVKINRDRKDCSGVIYTQKGAIEFV